MPAHLPGPVTWDLVPLRDGNNPGRSEDRHLRPPLDVPRHPLLIPLLNPSSRRGITISEEEHV